MTRITVAFLWHMHQPYYVDVAEQRATLPWVRLHALKDYLDLPAMARRFPSVHQTFNLVPSLLDQLDAYAEGRLTDPFLEVATRPARELSLEERSYLLREFFSYNPATMAKDLPRLEQLRRMRGARAPAPGDDAALAAWREEDLRDLQVLFHLAWCGPVLASRPPVSRLIEKGSGFTQEELAALLEEQRRFVGEVVAEYEKAAREGTIEISASPYYHPILPLVCDTDAAREATPRLPVPATPFRHPDDARTQVRAARRALERRFGSAPAGMWPSEGAVSNAALEILSGEGVRWCASDEDVLFSSLEISPRDPSERSRLLHRPYVGPGGTILFFRDHVLSDRIGFVYQSWDPRAAAADFTDRLLAIAEAAGGESRCVSIILDGENAWEFYQDNGAPFLSALFDRIASSDRIRARTFSEIVDDCRGGKLGITPAPLSRVRAGSWIRADLTTWIGHAEKNRAWELLARSRADLGPPVPGTPSGDSLLAAEGSDWFWWLGDEHSSAHDSDFDRTFRLHLQNAYTLAGRDAPAALASSIADTGLHRAASRPTGPVHVVLDGRPSDWFEWLPAGRADADLGRGTMSRSGRILRTMYYGSDGRDLAIRLDAFASSAAETLEGHAAVIELSFPAEERLRVPLRRGPCDSGPVRGFLDRILEMSVPLERIGAQADGRIDFRVLLEDGSGRRIETLPSEGFVSFRTTPSDQDWTA